MTGEACLACLSVHFLRERQASDSSRRRTLVARLAILLSACSAREKCTAYRCIMRNRRGFCRMNDLTGRHDLVLLFRSPASFYHRSCITAYRCRRYSLRACVCHFPSCCVFIMRPADPKPIQSTPRSRRAAFGPPSWPLREACCACAVFHHRQLIYLVFSVISVRVQSNCIKLGLSAVHRKY